MIWEPIETAPKDGKPIVVFHVHESDPYTLPDGTLTPFGAHFEGLSNKFRNGPCVAVWGGEYTSDESGDGWGPFTSIPDWWFLDDGYFETPLSPTHWIPLPLEEPYCEIVSEPSLPGVSKVVDDNFWDLLS